MKLPKWLGFLPDRNVSSEEVYIEGLKTPIRIVTEQSGLEPLAQLLTQAKRNVQKGQVADVIREARTSQGITQTFIAKKY